MRAGSSIFGQFVRSQKDLSKKIPIAIAFNFSKVLIYRYKITIQTDAGKQEQITF
jgi:hypothetical protein